jgi:hypothetical protein
LKSSWFPYLGSIIHDDDDDDDSISEEITHKLKKGNITYYAYKILIISILINKYNKRKIYMTLIKPVVSYTFES